MDRVDILFGVPQIKGTVPKRKGDFVTFLFLPLSTAM